MTVSTEGDVKLAVLAREHNGQLYLFAVNYDQRQVKAEARVAVEGLPAGAEVAVIDEDRTIRSEAGSFADSFEPLAVHIYQIREHK